MILPYAPAALGDDRHSCLDANKVEEPLDDGVVEQSALAGGDDAGVIGGVGRISGTSGIETVGFTGLRDIT